MTKKLEEEKRKVRRYEAGTRRRQQQQHSPPGFAGGYQTNKVMINTKDMAKFGLFEGLREKFEDWRDRVHDRAEGWGQVGECEETGRRAGGP